MQRPHAVRQVAKDFAVIATSLWAVAKAGWGNGDLQEIVDIVAEGVFEELDYRCEPPYTPPYTPPTPPLPPPYTPSPLLRVHLHLYPPPHPPTGVRRSTLRHSQPDHLFPICCTPILPISQNLIHVRHSQPHSPSWDTFEYPQSQPDSHRRLACS